MSQIHTDPPTPKIRIHFPGRFLSNMAKWIGIELNPTCPREKLIAGMGGFVSIFLLILITGTVLEIPNASALIASMGASAVLLFAVPHGQLSQPWPVIAGHGISALVGVACGRWIGSPASAAACAVGISIVLMHHLKCIHPPGGATALTAVIGGQAIHGLGFHFVLFPVLSNAAMMVAVAVLFNLAFKWRRYPLALSSAHEGDIPASHTHEEIEAAMRELGSFVDISEDDLLRLHRILNENRSKAAKLPRFRKVERANYGAHGS
jgi:CBS-domain-containing membrane protein